MNITERIADVLKREPVVYDEDEDYLSVETANRLASLLVAELGLTEEWSVEIKMGAGTIRTEPTPFRPTRLDSSEPILGRYVTPWTLA